MHSAVYVTGSIVGLRLRISCHFAGEPRIQHFEMERQNETIDYNERFSWDSRGWLVNRAFFGPFGETRVICISIMTI